MPAGTEVLIPVFPSGFSFVTWMRLHTLCSVLIASPFRQGLCGVIQVRSLSLGGSPASKSNRKGVEFVGKERKRCGVDLYCQYTERKRDFENESEFRQGSGGCCVWGVGEKGGLGVESGALLFVDPCDGWLCVCVYMQESERERQRLPFFRFCSFPIPSVERSRAGQRHRRVQTTAQQLHKEEREEKSLRGENKRTFFFNISRLWWTSNPHHNITRRGKGIWFPSQLRGNISLFHSFLFIFTTNISFLQRDLQGV